MNARVLVILSVHAFLSNCVTVNLSSETPEIISKSKIELTPILITSVLNDIVILSAPIYNAQAVYYLHRPNGDALQLNFEDNKTDQILNSNAVLGNRQSRVFNVNYNGSCCDATDVFATAKAEMLPNDFMIGPLQEGDHGNWVLSAYYQDIDEHWIEFFQVITVEITETVPLSPENAQLNIGDPFILSFAYPLSELESCQLEPPQSSFDRFYDRTRAGLDTCEFIVNNVTSADEGTWTIIGVGRVVYKGTMFLHVRHKNT